MGRRGEQMLNLDFAFFFKLILTADRCLSLCIFVPLCELIVVFPAPAGYAYWFSFPADRSFPETWATGGRPYKNQVSNRYRQVHIANRF